MSAFDLGLNIDFKTLAKILQKTGALTLNEITEFADNVTLNNNELKNLISLYANFNSITSISTANGKQYIQRTDFTRVPQGDELNIANFTFVKPDQKALSERAKGMAENFYIGKRPKPTDGLFETGVQLLYGNEKVTSMVGADYSRGKTVKAGAAAPITASAAAAPITASAAAARKAAADAKKTAADAKLVDAKTKNDSTEVAAAEQEVKDAEQEVKDAEQAVKDAAIMTGAGRTRARRRRRRKNKSYKKNSV